MTTSTLLLPSLRIGNIIELLRMRQRAIMKRSKSNPGMAMLALTAIVCFWVGQMRSRKRVPPRGIAIPQIYTRLYLMDVAYSFLKARLEGNELLWVQGLSKQGNTLATDIIGHRLVVTFEPSSVQHMLVKNFENYPKGYEFHKTFKRFLGTGIFNSDGPAWKNQRAIARPHFQVTEYKGATHIEKQINQVFDIIDRHIATSDGKGLEVQDLWGRYTIDTATDFLFGSCVNALESPKSKFVRAFNTVQYICGWRLRLCEYQRFVIAPKFNSKIRDMNEFLYPIVDAAIERDLKRAKEKKNMKERGQEEDETEHENLLMHFLHSENEFGEPMDRVYLRDMLMNFLLAGRDTSTNLLTFMCYNLGKHPEVLKRAREEVIEVIGLDRKPEHEDIKKLKYLKQIINETLRLYPAVPFNIKTALEDDVLPNGYYVPKGTLIVHSSYVTHRMKEYWGEDAEEFDPDRWGPERVKLIRPFMFFPFHAGPRICLGQNFAYNQALNTMSRVLQRYDWKVVEGFVPRPQSDVTMYSINGMQIIFERYHHHEEKML